MVTKFNGHYHHNPEVWNLTDLFYLISFVKKFEIIIRSFPASSKSQEISVKDETPVRVSFALTVASANIFLLMKKEG